MIGERFGRLIILEYAGNTPQRKRKWKCLCDCGKVVDTPTTGGLRSGNVQSCGCLNVERIRQRECKTHGHSRGGKTSLTYQSWRAMHQRCECPKNKDYHNYGGKGISISLSWKYFDVFLSDMGNRPSEDYSLDRIDPNKDYYTENCRWILKSENSRRVNEHKVFKVTKQCLNCSTIFSTYINREYKFCCHPCSTEYRGKVFRKEVGLHVN